MALYRILTPMHCSPSAMRCVKCSINFASDLRVFFITGCRLTLISCMSQLKIREMPREERPREKLAAHGPSALTDPELIAILLRTGVPGANAIEVARKLLKDYHSLRGLSRCSVHELEKIPGIGP